MYSFINSLLIRNNNKNIKAYNLTHTRGDPEIRGKVRLKRIAFIDCNEISQTLT